MASSLEHDMEWVVGRLKQIQTVYPQILQDVQQEGKNAKLSFYLEDISMGALRFLRTIGADAWQDERQLRYVHLALSSVLPRDTGEQMLQKFNRFLGKTASGVWVLDDGLSTGQEEGGD